MNAAAVSAKTANLPDDITRLLDGLDYVMERLERKSKSYHNFRFAIFKHEKTRHRRYSIQIYADKSSLTTHAAYADYYADKRLFICNCEGETSVNELEVFLGMVEKKFSK